MTTYIFEIWMSWDFGHSLYSTKKINEQNCSIGTLREFKKATAGPGVLPNVNLTPAIARKRGEKER